MPQVPHIQYTSELVLTMQTPYFRSALPLYMFSSNSTSLPYNGVSHNDDEWWNGWDLPCNGWWWYWFILVNVLDDDGDNIYIMTKCMSRKLSIFSSCVKTRFVTFYIHFLEWCGFQQEAQRETLRKSPDVPTQTVLRLDDQLLLWHSNGDDDVSNDDDDGWLVNISKDDGQ